MRAPTHDALALPGTGQPLGWGRIVSDRTCPMCAAIRRVNLSLIPEPGIPMPKTPALISALLMVAALGPAQAANGWDESVAGDLSNFGTVPTAITLGLGANLIAGTTGRVAGAVDRDYFTFTLPAGMQLESLTVLPGSTFLGQSELSFIGVQAGTQVTVSPTGGSAAGLLGWWHFGVNDVGTDILGLIGTGFGATGFNAPLQAGSYAFWVQDTGTGTAQYRLEFGVSAVPEPAAALLLLAGLAGLACQARVRRR